MKLNKYPDGTSYVSDTMVNEHVFKVNSYEDLWHLNQYVDAYHDKWGMTPYIIIPNLPDAQADRRFNEGESFGLKLVLKFLAGLDANFTIFHPHNSEVVEMAFEILGKKVTIMDNSEFVKKVFDSISIIKRESLGHYDWWYNTDSSNTILMSSDAGGFKPLMKLADKLEWKGETESASKSRKYEGGESKLIQKIDRQDFEGKDVLIIDDMCLYGGTFIGLAKMLKERNCGKLYLAVSHLTVSKPNPELFNLFDKVFTTNSKGLDYLVSDSKGEGVKPKNLEIINLF